MSEHIFKLPDLGEGTVESEIGEWFIKVGDQVTEADVVGTMMTDKAAVELSSPVSGKVIKLAGEPGDIVAVGAALVVFDVDGDASADVGGASAPTQVAVAAHGVAPRGKAAPTTKEIKVIGLRRIIAERMATATREIPHFTYVEEIDITELEALRKHLNSKNTDPAQRLTPLPFLGLALIRALREFPQCNTTYDKDRNILIQHGPVHLGVATQTNDGLKVPVVHNADALSLDQLASEIRRVSEAARNNSITRNELSGSTITVTSLGKLGGIVSTPVINQPEVGIIGVNRAVERPVVLNGQIDIRLMMNLSSSFDHRFVDGYDAAAMIQRIREMLEHPAMIFLPE
jgi:2-oxoisovalerate dehydrogenase E2 component (dihydrolipoyl transacylase)